MLPYSWFLEDPTSALASNLSLDGSRSPSYSENYARNNTRFRSVCDGEGVLDLTLSCFDSASYAADFTWMFPLLWCVAYPTMKRSVIHKLFLDNKASTSAKAEQELCSYLSIPLYKFFCTIPLLALYRLDMVSVASSSITLRSFRQVILVKIRYFLGLVML